MFKNKLKSQSEGTPKYLGESVTGLKFGDMGKTMWFVCSGSSSKCLMGMPADMQANYGISSAHAQCFSC